MALFLAWLFALAAAHKFRSGLYYRDLLSSYFDSINVGAGGVQLIASVECIVALLLLFPPSRSAGLAAGAIILLFYALMMALQVKRGRDDIACGCAGPASMLTVSPALVLRNFLCAALAVLSLAGSLAPMPLEFSAYSLSIVTATFMIVLYICSDQLIANAQLMAGDL